MTTTLSPMNRLGRLMVDQPLIPLTLILLGLVAVLAILNPAILSLFWASNTLKIAIPLAMLAACLCLAEGRDLLTVAEELAGAKALDLAAALSFDE